MISDLYAYGGPEVFDGLMELGGGCMLEERLELIAAEPEYVDWQMPEHDLYRHVGGDGEWTFEHISNTVFGSAGTYPGGIYWDQSAAGWMCGQSGGADFISVTRLSGSYSNRGSLMTKSRNVWSSCYLIGGSDSRVYSDDDIAMCIGSGMVFACGAIVPATSDFTTRR